MEEDAAAYSELNQPQIDNGSRFIRELRLSRGDKVLDMGCGTGDVTKYIAETVGCAGHVVGVDPDEARIKIAKEKFKNVGNLEFHVGDSVAGFPHDNEPYYDAHISTSTFHWVNYEEQNIYIQKAHQCLKPGGKLAILGGLKVPFDCGHEEMYKKINYYLLTQDDYRKLLEESNCLFSKIEVKLFDYSMYFNSDEELKRWTKASSHIDTDTLDPEYMKKRMAEYASFKEDGSVYIRFPYVTVTASKTVGLAAVQV